MTTKCPVCGKEYIYMDIRNIPPTCGDKICETNYEYQQKTYDPYTGKVKPMDKIKKW